MPSPLCITCSVVVPLTDAKCRHLHDAKSSPHSFLARLPPRRCIPCSAVAPWPKRSIPSAARAGLRASRQQAGVAQILGIMSPLNVQYVVFTGEAVTCILQILSSQSIASILYSFLEDMCFVVLCPFHATQISRRSNEFCICR